MRSGLQKMLSPLLGPVLALVSCTWGESDHSAPTVSARAESAVADSAIPVISASIITPSSDTVGSASTTVAQSTDRATPLDERFSLLESPHFFAISMVDSLHQRYRLQLASELDSLRVLDSASHFLAAPARLFFYMQLDSSAQAEALLKHRLPATSVAALPKDMGLLPVARKKALFFSALLPIVQFHNETIMARRRRLLAFAQDESRQDRRFFQDMSEHYALARHQGELPSVADSLRALLRRIDIVPPSLVLAQGAIESGWGTSRFARLGNNLFGQRVWRRDAGGLQAKGAQDARFRLAVYETISASVRSYMRNLNSHPAYAQLRELRAQLRANNEEISGELLAAGLVRYSTRGEEYVADVRRMIESNKLGVLDSAEGRGKR